MNDIHYPDEELNQGEREAFETLRQEIKLPDELQDKIIHELKNQHLIQSTMNNKKLFWAAAVLSALVTGFLLGRIDFNQPRITMNVEQEQFLLLLYEDDSFSGENISALIEEYISWAMNLQDKNQLAYAEKLKDEKFDLGNRSNISAAAVTGYFVIKASDLEEAMQIAKSHPHLKYNGSIELRPIEKLK
jgi:hypothetical protein